MVENLYSVRSKGGKPIIIYSSNNNINSEKKKKTCTGERRFLCWKLRSWNFGNPFWSRILSASVGKVYEGSSCAKLFFMPNDEWLIEGTRLISRLERTGGDFRQRCKIAGIFLFFYARRLFDSRGLNRTIIPSLTPSPGEPEPDEERTGKIEEPEPEPEI